MLWAALETTPAAAKVGGEGRAGREPFCSCLGLPYASAARASATCDATEEVEEM